MIFLGALPVVLILLAVLGLSAGRWDIGPFFAYAGLLWLVAGVVYTLAPPELVAERMKPPSDRDRSTRRIALPLILAHLVVAGLDVGRTHWSVVPAAAQAAGFALIAAGMGLAGWTVLSNPFASSAVRIQAERGHHVITTGPYALVRHPMYLGVLLFCLGSGPALGSWWSALPLAPVLAVFVRRTLLEDRMLHTELQGYQAYAAKVRWRVVPGIF